MKNDIDWPLSEFEVNKVNVVLLIKRLPELTTLKSASFVTPEFDENSELVILTVWPPEYRYIIPAEYEKLFLTVISLSVTLVGWNDVTVDFLLK
mmetsp:Transcript_2350/g.3077  ORF Transcript_2350/g.3077 Transcript_2350/m.3077 type:complete len:94 (-) Transcript_2350:152-433(-)